MCGCFLGISIHGTNQVHQGVDAMDNYERQKKYYETHKKEIYQRHKIKMQNDADYRLKRQQMYKSWYERNKQKNKVLQEKIDRAFAYLDATLDIILKQPTADLKKDEWIMNRLVGVMNILEEPETTTYTLDSNNMNITYSKSSNVTYTGGND